MLKGQSVVAVIPARKGSSGCPGKNFRPIAGKPLVMWSVEAALQSDGVDMVVVSTNDESVADVVKSHPEYGESILIVERPESLSGPSAKTEWAMIHALDQLKKTYKLMFDITVLLQPTSPARRNKLIDVCLSKVVDDGFDSVLTVTEETPFFWHLEKQPQALIDVRSEAGMMSVKEPQRLRAVPDYSLFDRPMRQKVQSENGMVFHDNGNVYACCSETLFELGQRIGYNPALVVTPFFDSLQIDTEEQFLIMEKLVELYGSFL